MNLGPEFNEKPHSGAIYTSRALSSLISRSTNSFSLDMNSDVNGRFGSVSVF